MNPTFRNILVAVAVLFVSSNSLYIVSEWEQAILTQFGRPVGSPVVDAGLHLKIPFIQRVRRFEKRILNWDGYPNQIPTKDKKYIMVDTTARWRITDPLLFLQTVQSESGARMRLDGILDAATRDIISSHNLVEAVRNSNKIIEDIEAAAKAGKNVAPGAEEEEIVGEIDKIEVGRESLSGMIIERGKAGLKEFGIELIDVQLRHISYEASVEAKVYERMISERQRIAQKIRSVGLGERSKIQGKISKDLQKIDSEAYRQAQEIQGQADAKAIRIYAQAMNSDPSFYEFVRTLEAYKKAIPPGTKMILSTDNRFLDLLRKR
ncbi:MAG: protease modulator HflC [Elusimicrobiota bacterium]